MKVDCLCFVKLDRLFRSVKLYYQAMDVLDKYHVAWQAIQEDYETVTANGRFKTNIMLSVSEQEADRTAERIKAVFDHKIEKGEAITRCQPFGYTVKDKRVVPDENAPAAKEMFEMFSETGNTWAVRDMIQNKYGIRLNYESVYRFLQNPIYTGRYRDNPQYCEPLVSQDLFDRVQEDFSERRKTKKAPSGRIYLFSGLIVCAECGRRWTASPGSKGSVHEERYRCPGHLLGKKCPNNRTVSEHKLEQGLLDIFSKALAGISNDYTILPPSAPTVNRSAITQKLARLKELYIDGDVTKAEYTTQKEQLEKTLSEVVTKPQRTVKALIGENFRTEYESMTKAKQRAYWRSMIDHVTIDRNLRVHIFLLS